MRSLEEIDADIAEVKARIAKRKEGMPNYGDPGYRAARFDYIVHGDRSGLDAYQNALNAAIQNKLSRESSEKMAKIGKQQASLEEDDEIVKNLSNSDAVVADLKGRNYADDSVEMKKALNERDYWVKRAARKGLNVAPYKDAQQAAPVAAPANAAAPQGRSYEDLSNYLTTIKDDKSVTRDTVKALRSELDLHKDKVPFSKMSESINLLNAKDKELSDSQWNEFNSRVKAANSEKDYGKRKAALEPLKEELANYKGQEKYAEVEKSINDGLKKPAKSPLPKYLNNTYTPNVVQQKYMRELNEKGEVKGTATIAGRSYPFKMVRKPNGDVEFVDDKGNVLKTIKAKDFDIEAPAPKKKENPVAGALKSGWTAKSNIKVGDDEDW